MPCLLWGLNGLLGRFKQFNRFIPNLIQFTLICLNFTGRNIRKQITSGAGTHWSRCECGRPEGWNFEMPHWKLSHWKMTQWEHIHSCWIGVICHWTLCNWLKLDFLSPWWESWVLGICRAWLLAVVGSSPPLASCTSPPPFSPPFPPPFLPLFPSFSPSVNPCLLPLLLLPSLCERASYR